MWDFWCILLLFSPRKLFRWARSKQTVRFSINLKWFSLQFLMFYSTPPGIEYANSLTYFLIKEKKVWSFGKVWKKNLMAFSTVSFENLNKVIIHALTGRFLIILEFCVPEWKKNNNNKRGFKQVRHVFTDLIRKETCHLRVTHRIPWIHHSGRRDRSMTVKREKKGKKNSINKPGPADKYVGEDASVPQTNLHCAREGAVKHFFSFFFFLANVWVLRSNVFKACSHK